MGRHILPTILQLFPAMPAIVMDVHICCSMWLILRLEGLNKCLSGAKHSSRYFCNLVISKVMINTLICNPISVIIKSLTHRPLDIGILPNHIKSIC